MTNKKNNNMKLIMENWRGFKNEEEEPSDRKDVDPKKVIKNFLAQVIKEEDYDLDEGLGDSLRRFKDFLDDASRRAYVTLDGLTDKTVMGVHGTMVDTLKQGNNALKALGIQDEVVKQMLNDELELKKTPENARKFAGIALVVAATAVELDQFLNSGVLDAGVGEEIADLIQQKTDDLRDKGIKMARG